MADVVAPRGMRDVLPEDFFLRDELIAKIRAVYESYGYCPMDTPCPERLAYLSAKAGGETEQLMFKIMKRAQEDEGAPSTELADMGLRYDLTVSLCRFYASNHDKLPAIFRRYQIAPVWRADRPQRGRLREFYQCDVDIIGEASSLAECEVILATTEALARLSIDDHVVKMSDRRLMPLLLDAIGIEGDLARRAMVSIDKLDKIGVTGVAAESARYLDQKSQRAFAELVATLESPSTRAFAITALGPAGERSADRLAPILEGLAKIEATVRAAASAPLRLELWPTLVRGMAYYSGPIFEIWNASDPFSLAGGGRYDGLVGQFLGKDVPACGFSIGFERILAVLKARASNKSQVRTRASALVALRHEGLEAEGLKTAARLRAEGVATELHPYCSNMKKQFKHAELLGMRWIVVREDEGEELVLIDTEDRSRVPGDTATLAQLIRERSL